MVIRDLTLRSAASFGSFHLIRLLYDEYMFYLIENRVARATGEMPIAVMGDRSGQPQQEPPTQTAAEREVRGAGRLWRPEGTQWFGGTNRLSEG